MREAKNIRPKSGILTHFLTHTGGHKRAFSLLLAIIFMLAAGVIAAASLHLVSSSAQTISRSHFNTQAAFYLNAATSHALAIASNQNIATDGCFEGATLSMGGGFEASIRASTVGYNLPDSCANAIRLDGRLDGGEVGPRAIAVILHTQLKNTILGDAITRTATTTHKLP